MQLSSHDSVPGGSHSSPAVSRQSPQCGVVTRTRSRSVRTVPGEQWETAVSKLASRCGTPSRPVTRLPVIVQPCSQPRFYPGDDRRTIGATSPGASCSTCCPRASSASGTSACSPTASASAASPAAAHCSGRPPPPWHLRGRPSGEQRPTPTPTPPTIATRVAVRAVALAACAGLDACDPRSSLPRRATLSLRRTPHDRPRPHHGSPLVRGHHAADALLRPRGASPAPTAVFGPRRGRISPLRHVPSCSRSPTTPPPRASAVLTGSSLRRDPIPIAHDRRISVPRFRPTAYFPTRTALRPRRVPPSCAVRLGKKASV
jgi:hypothetical protein